MRSFYFEVTTKSGKIHRSVLTTEHEVSEAGRNFDEAVEMVNKLLLKIGGTDCFAFNTRTHGNGSLARKTYLRSEVISHAELIVKIV